ncbi:exocyst subunit [Coniosporium tulheliwenetii]|uniref:Exocyst subunit n=1 Tax=Coniosporium tulheliwenetii TaxID=3383036 RepID=A0ACC2Z5X6_9PEZI|nr:exocyst subunit [Cladosporium sp. JES 115]
MSRPAPSQRSEANGMGGYTNGYSDGADSGRYGQNGTYGQPTRQDGSPRRPRERPGGYGGFGAARFDGQESGASQVARPTSLERARANRRSGDRWDKSRSRSRAAPGGEGSRQIEEVLRYMQQEWSFMTQEQPIPVQTALKLLDASSLGLASRYTEFQDAQKQLQAALKAIVNEHHQGFNSSIGTFHKIQSSIQTSQTRVRTLKDSLVQAKGNLSTTKPELKSLATTSQDYDDMLQVLGNIEQLQNVSEKLEARISEKRFLTAVDVLQDALRLIRRSDMEGIGALSDLRVYLSNQEHSLTDILIEELHSHLYLKSPYCEDRWKIYAPNQSTDSSATTIDKLDPSEPLVDDSSRNPEADTFQYIQLLIEALNKMSRLDVAVEMIEQRLPVELFRVVEKSNNEAAQRHPSVVRSYASKTQNKTNTSPESDDGHTTLLQDLLWTLYARFEAIAEGHRVVHDVVTGIVRREGLRDTAALTGGFNELWKLYQSEIRSLLHDYLATDGEAYRTGQGAAGNSSVFQRTQRDRNKRMFKLSDMDAKSTELASEREDLEFILKSSVPGLVSDLRKPDGISASETNDLQDRSATGHKLLVEPSVFNMGVLLPPSLDFLNRLKSVVPSNTDVVPSTLTSFLDDFLVNVFHPQLEETLTELCAQTFIEAGAFQEDTQWQTHSQKPIFKGTTKFFNLIAMFCKMLNNLPHDQAFSQLIITQMVTYYDRCYGWYKALASRAQPKAGNGRRLKSPAALAEAEDVRDVLARLAQSGEQSSKELFKEKWLASKISHFRHISDRATDSTRRSSSKPQPQRRWTVVTSPELEKDAIYLPMNQDTASAFDGVINSYITLSTTALHTLHLTLRTHILHRLPAALPRSYLLSSEATTPDSGIVALAADLVAFDTVISSYLLPPQRRFVVNGLADLADRALVRALGSVTEMNGMGKGRVELGVLVLQQNLKNVEPGAKLSRSERYCELFEQGPQEMLRVAEEEAGKEEEEREWSKEELRVLAELWFSEGRGARGGRCR